MSDTSQGVAVKGTVRHMYWTAGACGRKRQGAVDTGAKAYDTSIPPLHVRSSLQERHTWSSTPQS
jgi:hypothetical protein